MKQSSVDWLFEELFNSFEKFSNGDFSLSEYMTHNLVLRKQAKAMHKEEIEDAYEQGEQDGYWHPEDGWIKEFANSQQYYNEKFGGDK